MHNEIAIALAQKLKIEWVFQQKTRFINNFWLTHRDRQGDRAIEANTDK
jgi:hypothetical protein